MYPRLVSAAAALILASAAATALAQSYDVPARTAPATAEARIGLRFPAPPSYGPDAVATLRDILVTGSVRTHQDERRSDEAAAR